MRNRHSLPRTSGYHAGMSNQPATTLIERLLDAIVDQLTPEAARVVSDLYAPDEVKARIDALVAKIMAEGLEPAEQDEYDGLMQVVHTISMIQDRIDARAGGPAVAAAPVVVHAPPIQGEGFDPFAIESVDLGLPSVVPNPARASAVQFDGLEAMLEDLDEAVRPGPPEP